MGATGYIHFSLIAILYCVPHEPTVNRKSYVEIYAFCTSALQILFYRSFLASKQATLPVYVRYALGPNSIAASRTRLYDPSSILYILSLTRASFMQNIEVGDVVLDNYAFFPWPYLYITCNRADQTKTQILNGLGLES